MNRSQAYQMADEARLLRYCAPIFFLPSSDPEPSNITSNATVSLIDTGEKKLIITCAHVWHGFQQYRDRNSEAKLAVLFADGYGFPQYLELSPLALDQDLDIAVFDFPPAWDIGKKEFYRVYRWPISKASSGEVAAFLGFAGESRYTEIGFGRFDYSFFGLGVTASSDRKAILGNPDKKEPMLNKAGLPIPKMEIKGMSGSPAYVLNRQGIFRLVGFVQMGQTSDDPVFITHAWFLNPDGTLKK